MERIAIFGGAFDPIHVDHVKIAEKVLEWGFADKIRFVVAPDSRWDKNTKVTQDNRLDMVKLAIKGKNQMEAVKEEGEHRGSLRMMEKITKNDPENLYLLMVGADNYEKIPTWKDYTEGGKTNGTELMKKFPLIVCPRKGIPMPNPETHKMKGYANLFIPPENEWEKATPTSSTQVRDNLFNNKPTDNLVDPKVLNYIRENDLYR